MMDMGGGRLIRVMILVLGVVLIWKVWDYSSLPALELPNFGAAGKSAISGVSGAQLKEQEEQQLVVTVAPTMRVDVYYEALCSDSRHFIMKQLTPAYNKLKDIVHIALIPYGKAETHEKAGKITFDCQHGPTECEANKVHACVTNVVRDEAKQVAIVHCMIDRNEHPMKAGQKCVEKQGEPWAEVEKCATSDKGDSILKHMGDMTRSLKPGVSFIPTITIDGSQADQKHILLDLHKVLCKRYKGPLPPSC